MKYILTTGLLFSVSLIPMVFAQTVTPDTPTITELSWFTGHSNSTIRFPLEIGACGMRTTLTT